MADLDKLYEKAEKYLQKQKFDSALEAYAEIYRYKPRDEGVLLNLSDLSLRLNKTSDALRYMGQLADHYIQRNDLVKAVATCRKIVKTSPQDAATWLKIANLQEKAKKVGDAIEAYREALAVYNKSGGTAQAIDCLQHIVKLDPNNLEAHVELGELASRSGQSNLATPAFLTAAQLARQAGNASRWAELVERAHMLDPSDDAAGIAAGEVALLQNRDTDAIGLLEPVIRRQPDNLDVAAFLARAHIKVGDYAKAQPFAWKVYEQRPEQLELVQQLAEGLVQKGQADKALALAQQIRGPLFKQGKKNEYLSIIEKVYAADESNLATLELLTNLYDEMNREDGLRRSLVRLFNLYLGAENYDKAGDTLERIIDVDPYGEGHGDRLLNLEGHIDKIWYENIASRLQLPSTRATAAATTSAKAGGAVTEALDDLVIEGEMFLQYQLTSKLSATLEKINQLYPGAEETNPRLQALYEAAGFHPRPGPAGAKPAATPPARPAEAPRAAAAAPAPIQQQSLDELRKISEITANIYREATPQGVLQVAVNEVGRATSASRVWGALGGTDRPPTLTVEYCSPSTPSSDVEAALKIYTTLMSQAASKPDGWAFDDVLQTQILRSVAAEVQKLGIKSLLALPLMDKDQPGGLLVIEQCSGPRAWTPGDNILLSTLATQVVIAVNNTRLRRLVKSLAGTDEETGLLPRSSYIDCLLSEAGRALSHTRPLSVCLLEPENPSELAKALGESGLQRYLKLVAKSLQSSLRQNDIPIRYNPCAIAVVFPDTPLPQGGLAVEKLRRVIAQVKADGATNPNFCSAVCDVHLGPSFDAVDGVTEVINRLETALEQSRREGGRRVFLSKFEG